MLEFDEFTDLATLLQSRWNSLAWKKSEYLACRKEIGDWKTESGGGKSDGIDRKSETGFGDGGAKPGKSKSADENFEDENSKIGGNKGDNPEDNDNASESEEKSAESAGLKLPTTTVSIDQRIKLLDRKFQMMQTILSDDGGIKTLTAWAITRNFWRYCPRSKK